VAALGSAPRAHRYIDPHHHLWERGGETYLVDEFGADLDSYMAPVTSVYLECLNHYKADGEDALRCTGETEFFAALVSGLTAAGRPNLIGGFVGFGDLALGDDFARVLDAHSAIAGERLKGVRYPVAFDEDPGIHAAHPTRAGMLLEDAVPKAAAHLESRGLSLDVWAYFTQLPELAALLNTTANFPVVLNHCGGPIGVGRFSDRREAVFGEWRQGMARVAQHERLTVKFGGMAMAIAGFRWHRRAQRPRADELAAAWRPYFDVCLELFGPERIMFESNFPVDRKGADYVALWHAFELLAAGLSADERDQLFYGTARRIYRL
jgi:predicted TIM-barrel fold metal-dependent hydrolase